MHGWQGPGAEVAFAQRQLLPLLSHHHPQVARALFPRAVLLRSWATAPGSPRSLEVIPSCTGAFVSRGGATRGPALGRTEPLGRAVGFWGHFTWAWDFCLFLSNPRLSPSGLTGHTGRKLLPWCVQCPQGPGVSSPLKSLQTSARSCVDRGSTVPSSSRAVPGQAPDTLHPLPPAGAWEPGLSRCGRARADGFLTWELVKGHLRVTHGPRHPLRVVLTHAECRDQNRTHAQDFFTLQSRLVHLWSLPSPGHRDPRCPWVSRASTLRSLGLVPSGGGCLQGPSLGGLHKTLMRC